MLGHSLRSRLRSTAGRRFTRGTLSSASLSQEAIGLCGVIGNGRLEGTLDHSCGQYVSQRFKSKFAYPEGMKSYEDDWAEEAEYPEITETHDWNDYRRERLQAVLDFHGKIRNASCPEAKNFEWNMPRQYGYKVHQVFEDLFEYDSLKAYKYITRTHVASSTHLPSQYSSPDLNEKVEYFKNKLKEPLLDALTFELDTPRPYEQDFNALAENTDLKRSQTIIPQLNRVILNVLGPEVGYLKDCQVDVCPNIEAFWHLGGIEAEQVKRDRRKKNTERKDRFKARYVKPDDPTEANLHYIGKSLLQLRCKDPPENFVGPSDPLCQRSDEIPDRFPHFLDVYGINRPDPDKDRFASFIPGHWSGDIHRCNLIGFHPRHHLAIAKRAENPYWSTKEETEEALQSQAMLASFGRLVSQALYHGFDQFTDLDYPFSTQTIITNGLEWSFFAYQLNTIKLDERSIAKNPKQNILWGTQTESIFDNEKKELNDSVISNLLRFYLNPPRPIAAENPTPYLTDRIQDWDGDRERDRILTFYNYRDMICQRIYRTPELLKFRPPEIHEYEWIYKIYFRSMPLDKPLRHFEFPLGYPGYNPYILPYPIRDPTYESKGIVRLRAEVAARKEKEAVEAAKLAEAKKYGVLPVHTNKKRK